MMGLFFIRFGLAGWLVFCLIGLLFPGMAAAEEKDRLFNRLTHGERIIKGWDSRPKERPTVYLTFDDGPSPLTPQVLSILKKEQVKASFFVLGQAAEERPEWITEMVKDGHAIGNHSYNHEYQQLYQGFQGFWQQVQQTSAILKRITGQAPQLLRAPGGTYSNWDAFYFYFSALAGYHVFDWNIDSGDSKRKGVSTDEIIQNIQSARLSKETVVLLHDSGGHANSVKALPEIIRYFKKKGYQFAALDSKTAQVVAPLGKVKARWKRSMTPEKMNQWVNIVSAIGSATNKTGNATMKTGNMETTDSNLEVSLLYAGKKLALTSADSFMEQGEVYVALRDVGELLGGQVLWDEARGEAVIVYQQEATSFSITGDKVIVQNGRMFVPIEDLLKTMKQKLVNIEKKNGTMIIKIEPEPIAMLQYGRFLVSLLLGKWLS